MTKKKLSRKDEPTVVVANDPEDQKDELRTIGGKADLDDWLEARVRRSTSDRGEDGAS